MLIKYSQAIIISRLHLKFFLIAVMHILASTYCYFLYSLFIKVYRLLSVCFVTFKQRWTLTDFSHVLHIPIDIYQKHESVNSKLTFTRNLSLFSIIYFAFHSLSVNFKFDIISYSVVVPNLSHFSNFLLIFINFLSELSDKKIIYTNRLRCRRSFVRTQFI